MSAGKIVTKNRCDKMNSKYFLAIIQLVLVGCSDQNKIKVENLNSEAKIVSLKIDNNIEFTNIDLSKGSDYKIIAAGQHSITVSGTFHRSNFLSPFASGIITNGYYSSQGTSTNVNGNFVLNGTFSTFAIGIHSWRLNFGNYKDDSENGGSSGQYFVELIDENTGKIFSY